LPDEWQKQILKRVAIDVAVVPNVVETRDSAVRALCIKQNLVGGRERVAKVLLHDGDKRHTRETEAVSERQAVDRGSEPQVVAGAGQVAETAEARTSCNVGRIESSAQRKRRIGDVDDLTKRRANEQNEQHDCALLREKKRKS
jgi:hypothetical protein